MVNNLCSLLLLLGYIHFIYIYIYMLPCADYNLALYTVLGKQTILSNIKQTFILQSCENYICTGMYTVIGFVFGGVSLLCVICFYCFTVMRFYSAKNVMLSCFLSKFYSCMVSFTACVQSIVSTFSARLVQIVWVLCVVFVATS